MAEMPKKYLSNKKAQTVRVIEANRRKRFIILLQSWAGWLKWKVIDEIIISVNNVKPGRGIGELRALSSRWGE